MIPIFRFNFTKQKFQIELNAYFLRNSEYLYIYIDMLNEANLRSTTGASSMSPWTTCLSIANHVHVIDLHYTVVVFFCL